MYKEKTINSDLVLLSNSEFVKNNLKMFIRKFSKQKNNEILKISKIIELEDISTNNISENLIKKIDNQQENLIVIVDFKEEFQINSDLIQLFPILEFIYSLMINQDPIVYEIKAGNGPDK